MPPRKCETCLYFTPDAAYPEIDFHQCRRSGARYSAPRRDDWCDLWEPRDRSLVRCATCEWWVRAHDPATGNERAVGECRTHRLADNGIEWLTTFEHERCPQWRLREEEAPAP